MSPSPAQESDAILAAARASLADQRAGGRRSPAHAPRRSIGRQSRALKARQLWRRLGWLAGGLVALMLAGMVASLLGILVIGGIGILLLLGLLAAGLALALPPRVKVPPREALAKSNMKMLVAEVQLWLEAQRPALPPAAARALDHIGAQLDVLNLQLAGLADEQPAATGVRQLVGELLPSVVAAYTAIPAPLRATAHAGTTPDEQIATSLARISGEIDSLTRQLAEGPLDSLAIQTRFLDYRYGEGGED